MALSAKPLHPLFAAELTGADLAAGIDPATRDTIERAMDEYAVVVLPGQRLDDDKQIAFASLYGPLEVSPPVHSKDGARGGDLPHPEPQHLRRLQSRRTRPDTESRRPAPRLPGGQPALAHRQLVPAEVGDLVDAARPHHPAGRRRHAIRRYPRRL